MSVGPSLRVNIRGDHKGQRGLSARIDDVQGQIKTPPLSGHGR
jgi:hypothetical protein